MPDARAAALAPAVAKYRRLVDDVSPLVASGRVRKIVGLVIEGNGPRTAVGGVCEVRSEGRPSVDAEIVGFAEDSVYLMPLGDMRHIAPRARIVAARDRATVRVGDAMLGRVLDGLGAPLDGKRSPLGTEERFLYGRPINPATRRRISQPLDLGVRVLNGLLTVGKGQKIGLFAGSGVGKSVLMGMIARHTHADVNVISLIGERGREVREFLERDLGPEGLARSVVIAATSDQSPLVRMRGAFLGTTIAEYFRAQGKHVLFMMDSLTRFAMARREVGLSVGEPPTTRGYTPSVFTLMPALLERVGNDDRSGSITGIYTVLVEADDMNDPIGDAARSILDGHVVLSRAIAAKNLYPAIDLLSSASRCMTDVAGRAHLDAAGQFRATLATYREAEDLINIGAYAKGSNPKIDDAIAKFGALTDYVRQPVERKVTFEESVQHLESLFAAR
jgi:flagellum-specific ATP synthase